MIFPNTQAKMRVRDWLLLLTPGVIGGITVLLKAAFTLGVAVTLVWALMKNKMAAGEAISPYTSLTPEQGAAMAAAGMALFGIAGFMARQWLQFKNRKIFFMKTLADSLYFRNLDNNQGVLHHLIDEAEEEECKEALLAYYFLLQSPAGLTEAQLDAAVEQWLLARHGLTVDFEVDDGLGKLRTLELALSSSPTVDAPPVWRAVGLDDACRRVDEVWDNVFRYHGTEVST